MAAATTAPPAEIRGILSRFGASRMPDGSRVIRAFGLSRREVAQLAIPAIEASRRIADAFARKLAHRAGKT